MGKKSQLGKDHDAPARQEKLSEKQSGKAGDGAAKDSGKELFKNASVQEEKTKKRDQEKYPGLKKNLFSKIKQEYHDYDYVDKLNHDEKVWLSKFTEENLGANTDPNKKAYDEKTTVHPKDYNKKIYAANNARNRDIQSLKRVTGKLVYEHTEDTLEALDENELNDQIDVTNDIKQYYSTHQEKQLDLPEFVEETSKLVKGKDEPAKR